MRKERGCERESNRERVRDFQCNVVYASLRCSSSLSSRWLPIFRSRGQHRVPPSLARVRHNFVTDLVIVK